MINGSLEDLRSNRIRRIHKIKQLCDFTIELFDYIGWTEVESHKSIKFETDFLRPDFVVELDNKKYAIEVKHSFDLDTTKIKLYLERFKIIENAGYKNIIIVYDKINPRMFKAFGKEALLLDISNILYLIRNSKILTNKLMGILDYSIGSIEPIDPLLKIKVKEHTIVEEDDSILILSSIPYGRNFFKDYQTFCFNTLKFLFLDELDLWKEQNKTEEGVNVFDLICKIKNNVDCEFFTMIEEYFKSKYVIFEFKNYEEEITQYEVCTTEKYLYETALRKVAIVFSRKGIDKNGQKMVKGILRETGKLILNLDDNDVIDMIKLKESGENPSIILMNKLDDLLTHLEK